VSTRPSPTRRALRWGLGDVVWVWLAGLVAAAVAASIATSLRGRGAGLDPDGVDLVVGLYAQNVTIVAGLVFVSRRKGLGTLREDFGLVVRAGDWPWLAAGVLLQVLSIGMVSLLDLVAGTLDQQQAVETLQDSSGPEVFFLVLGVALMAPVVEELLFRGLLLRSLVRKMSSVAAVVVSAVTFGVVHLLDPSTAPVMAPLILVGLIAGIRTVRSGDLSQAILLHGGFNLLSAIVLVTT
jgi:membrane protease YdiL (CAAX protease family)